MTTTQSPLDDPKVREETEKVAKDEYGEGKTEQIKEKVAEMYVKTQDYEVNIDDDETIEFSGSKSDLDFDLLYDLLKDTKHLELFDAMNISLGLDGDAYLPAKKGLYYFENSIKQDTTVVKINQKVRFDNRSHLLVFGEASAGKSTIKSHVKNICNSEIYHEISGLSHEKQLIGTQVQKGKGDKKETEVIPGIMSYKVVVNDETQDLLNEKNEMYAHAQRTKRLAMDTYGENEFNDKNVKTEKENRLKYCSESRVLDLAHPKKLTSPFFDNGGFRRYPLITSLNPDKELKLNDITDFKFDLENTKINMKEVFEEFYKKNRKTPEFTENTLNIISLYHKALLFYLLKHKNQNAFRFGLLTRYSLRNMFCKNVLILSISKNESKVENQTTLDACYDTLLFILESIKTIDGLGNMGISSDVWGGVCENDAQALEYLFRKGCVGNGQSSVSIRKFWTILSHLYGCKITQARAHFYRLKREGFIDSRKDGQYDSLVWLKFQPKEINLNSQNYDGLTEWLPLFQSVGSKNDLLALSKKLFSDDKALQNSQSDGSVGILGCILSKYILCVEPNKIDNLDFFNTYRGQKPTVPTVCNKNQPTATIKQEVQTAKTPKNKPTLSSKKSKSNSPESPNGLSGPSDRDTQYWADPVTADINPCNKQEVLDYTISKPDYTLPELLGKFGPGVMALKKEGSI